ncbi:hypothetical protein [Paraconexibacter sp.]|uniref:hypothetical protein n=1 Tax=Paraconexibacter sp. TaxID=2949640 RepID=UPI00356A12A3
MSVHDLPHLIDVRFDDDGLPVVTVVFDLTPAQVDGALHALRTVREARFALTQLTTDEALALRELTSLVDEYAVIVGADANARIESSVARLGVLRGALAQFSQGEHPEREGDSAAHPTVMALLAAIEDLHAEAVRAALQGAATRC